MSWRLFDITAKRAELAPGAIAFEDARSGETLSYGALETRAAQAAAWLVQRGVKPGDRLGVLCRNRTELFELLFACGKTGAILVPLNWRMTAAELTGMIADCAPALILCGDKDAGAAKAAAGDRPIVPLDVFSAERETLTPHPGRAEWPADEAWFLIYTSGTTGAPKGVINTYGMALANFVNIGQALALSAADSTFNHLPLFHSAGINLVTLPLLMSGGRVLIARDFEAAETLSLLGAGRISVMFSVPTVYRALCEAPEFAETGFSAVRSWACGGAPLSERVVMRFAERGALIRHGFGMSESGPTTLLMDEASVLAKPGAAGRPQLLSRARVVDDSGTDLPDGETGEIWLSGPGVTPGYWGQPEETAKIFSADGWLKTGDLGRRDSEGDFHIVGRIKEMIISGGANVFPAEIEAVLNRHPDVADAAVIGAPDEVWGEAGHAFIQPRPDRAPGRGELEAFCRDQLAGYKIPKTFTFVDTFPRTASGKIQKSRLTAPAAETV